MTDAAVSILSEVRCHLGEGATWDATAGIAWWFDVLERRLFEASPETGEVRVHAMPVMASALGTVDADRQLLSAEDGLYLRRRSGGEMKLLHAIGTTGVARRSNDGRAHPCGTFWFSMMGRRAEAGAGAIEVPARQPSCPAFVGRQLQQLLVTSALEGMDAAARSADPHGGKTFLIDAKVRGRPEPRISLS